jgi:hypothetical protein
MDTSSEFLPNALCRIVARPAGGGEGFCLISFEHNKKPVAPMQGLHERQPKNKISRVPGFCRRQERRKTMNAADFTRRCLALRPDSAKGCATYLRPQGAGRKAIQDLFGNGNFKTPLVYTQVGKEEPEIIKSPLASLKPGKKSGAP